MPINVRELPPAYQIQALRKLAEQKESVQTKLPSAAEPTKNGKYHNRPTERLTATGNVIHFDSQKEAGRYDYLIGLENEGKIKDLRLQVNYTLQEAYTDSQGHRVRAIRYVADFTYQRPTRAATGDSMASWELVVEDVKSKPTKTKTYEIKRKLLKERFGLTIKEI